MGAIFSRIKNWGATETVTNTDLNAEFDNILTNLVPLMFDDYSVNVAQMQVTTDPGEVGTESLATTLGGELARIRFMIKEITGEDQWYASAPGSINSIINAIGGGLPNNRIISGRKRAGSNQGIFLVPNGAARTITANGTSTNLIYQIAGTQYSITSAVTIVSLTAAPSSNNTCLVADSTIAGGNDSRLQGENGTDITIGTVGTEISSLVGKIAAFKVGAEYFLAEVDSATKLSKVMRGYFFNSADNPLPRVAINNGDTITLMKLSWIFATTTSTLAVTYNNPRVSADEPSSPAIGDYWFDTVNNIWKVYSGSVYAAADATLIGVCIQDTTATIAARSFDFFNAFAADNTVELYPDTNSSVKSRDMSSLIRVFGSTVRYAPDFVVWDMTLNLDSGVTEVANTDYYFYVTETGDSVISDVAPYDRRADLYGYYHPHQTWRCVGTARNNNSSNLEAVTSYYNRHAGQNYSRTLTAAKNLSIQDTFVPVDTSGGAVTVTLPPAIQWRGKTISIIKTTSDFTAVTVDGFLSETINGSANTTLNTQYELIEFVSDGSNVLVKTRQYPRIWTSYTPTFQGFGTAASITFYWRRDGDSVLIRGRFTTGTVTAAEARISLPSGLTSATTFASTDICGYASSNTLNTAHFVPLIEVSVAHITWGLKDSGSGAFTKVNGNQAGFIGSSTVTGIFTMPIAITGWAG